MSSIKKGKKNPERKILRRKSKGNFIWENGLHNTRKKKCFIKSPTSLVSGKRTATCVLRHSTRSFGNKPLVALDWSSKSRKRHYHLPKCDRGKRIRGKILFLEKNIIFWDCTHNIFNFNKYFVCIIFLFVLLIL